MDDFSDYDAYDDDDNWLYAEDEFALADELAESQIPNCAWAGTNFEISMESYEFELFAFWDDLEYADDAYWDYGLPLSEEDKSGWLGARKGVKRLKRELLDREHDPCVFRSREERMRRFRREPPDLGEVECYTFMGDWRERFEGKDGEGREVVNMPSSMRRAAEAVDAVEDVEDVEEDEEWEDEEEDGEDDSEGSSDLLQSILKQKLNEAGLGGVDQSAFMETIAKMMAGDTDASDDLATNLLGKLTSSNGDSALSGWLSQQGVSLGDEDDDASTTEGLTQPRHLNTSQQDSPIDSVVGSNPEPKSRQMAVHESPSSTKKKRAALEEADEDEAGRKKLKKKKVTFDVPPSSSSDAAPGGTENGDVMTSEDPLMSETTVGGQDAPKTGRKRKATSMEAKAPPEKKGRRKKDVEVEGGVLESPMGPPARRTRAARARGGK